jgi:hypothetical protein
LIGLFSSHCVLLIIAIEKRLTTGTIMIAESAAAPIIEGKPMSDMFDTNQIELDLDTANFYTESSYTDLKSGAIRKLTPVTIDGDDDPSRSAIFLGTTQLMTPEGPLPIQARLPGNNLKEAVEAFARTMRQAIDQTLTELKSMAEKAKKEDDSRIIVPGR